MNRNYIKGRNKEYRIMKKFRDAGFEIVTRTAGSHSPIDVIAIKRTENSLIIKFIQSKPKKFKKDKLIESLKWLNCTNVTTSIEIL